MITQEENIPIEDDTNLIEERENIHYPLRIGTALYIQLLMMITLVAGGFLLPVFYRNEEPMSMDTFSLVIYLDLFVWAIVTISTWYVKAEHKNSRVLGYHEFYDSTRHMHRVAFYTMSGGNVLLLVVTCLTHNYCLGGGISACSLNLQLTPVNYQQIIFIIEAILCIPFLMKHIIEVSTFNESNAPPDVFVYDAAYRLNQGELVIGIRGPDHVVQILERQANQIITLNERNRHLNAQIYVLTQELLNQRPLDSD